jgi:hypothetical protein
VQEQDPNSSPWVDHWTDESYRKRYEFHARENYEVLKELRVASQRGHIEYGKWLIASMLAIHGGAIYTISGLRISLPVGSDLSGLVNAGVWHVMGISFIMLAGFLAWVNFQCAEHIYFKRANPAMLYRTDHEQYERKTDPIGATLYGSAAFGLGSAFCFVAGAAEVFRCLRSAAGS